MEKYEFNSMDKSKFSIEKSPISSEKSPFSVEKSPISRVAPEFFRVQDLPRPPGGGDVAGQRSLEPMAGRKCGSVGYA